MPVAILALALSSPAQALKAGDIEPQPVIAAELDDFSFDVLVDDGIPQHHVTRTDGIMKLRLDAWRSAIHDGFSHALRDAEGPTRLTIQVSRADLELVPVAVGARSRVDAVNGRISFEAHLLDELGEVTCIEVATAVADEPTSDANAMGELVGSAIESMVEIFAAECLTGLDRNLGLTPTPILQQALEPEVELIPTTGEETEPVDE